MVNFYKPFVLCSPNNKPTAGIVDVAGKIKCIW